jgi:hypothetical protein
MTTFLARILACGTGLAAFAAPACAVNLAPNGLGQVLIYPYYTVSAHQQTLVSVVNTTSVGKVVKVRFREAYNGRVVFQFNLYLSAYDAWTANVFALSDANITGDLAGLATSDESCTDPPLNATFGGVPGKAYRSFATDQYTGGFVDTGPAGDARTREGHIEMILMSDVLPDSALFHAITHVNGVPPGCTTALLENAGGYAAPTLDPLTGNAGTAADGGLFGSASIVDVAGGVFYAYNADALDGFSYRSLYTLPNDPQPTLASVNDRNDADSATARVFVDGASVAATFPGATPGSRKVDAVSAVFAANNVYNEYVSAPDGSSGTDWVVVLPTKHLYVDAQPGGPIAGAANAFAPFEQPFGALKPGQSCVTSLDSLRVFDRDENVSVEDYCGFSTCPPGFPGSYKLCLETNVLAFALDASVLGSQLISADTRIRPLAVGGWLAMDLSQSYRQLYPASNGDVFHGLPLTGFAAIKFVNGAVPAAGAGSALANYSGVYHHRLTSRCTNSGSEACQ